jgi:tetratricopeptide (TPR) repeat protein
MFRMLAFVTAFLAAASLASAQSQTVTAPDSPVLAAFDFDGTDVETGPYTLIAYENARGSVALTSRFRHSGTRSVEIRDVAGDGDFAELQGFFREMPSGKVFVHFAFMLAEPAESMNIALAGAGHFGLRKDGFGFWLKCEKGTLYQVSNRKDLALFQPRAFTWYVADVAYDVDAGRYDLQVSAEGEARPLVSLRSLPNPMGLRGSRIHKFSFIGDPPGIDRSNARFYVDDIVVRADHAVPQEGPFLAPGRRMLFIDVYRYYRSLLYEKPGCVPALGPEDFGLTSVDLHDLAEHGRLRLYDELADRRVVAAAPDLGELAGGRLAAMVLWGQGCAAGCRGACSLPFFEKAHAQVPEAKLYGLSRVFALAAQQRWQEADELFADSYPDWRGDPRFPAISALLGMARGDLDAAEYGLNAGSDRDPSPAEYPVLRRLWAGHLDQPLVRELRDAFPTTWSEHVEAALAAEHRYYVLIWREQYDAARAFADRMVDHLRAMQIPAGAWLERRGDALFWRGDVRGAGQSYEEALTTLADPAPVYAKLSDVYFALGDSEAERRYREKVYGSLRR